MGLFSRRRAVSLAADGVPLPPPSPIQVQLAAIAAMRASGMPPSRAAAMRLSVVNRARDLICGTLGTLPLARYDEASGRQLEQGWLGRPDPDHTAGWVQAWTTDDLFFYERAWWRTTAYGDDLPLAIQWVPFREAVPFYDGLELDHLEWYPRHRGGAGPLPDPVLIDGEDVITFESPVTGILESGLDVLTTAMRLDLAAERFAAVEVPAGWLKQTGGDPLGPTEADQTVALWQAKRAANATAFLNETIDYHESTMDPSRLQLVQGRSYQDAAVARICNTPNFAVGVAVPGDSMTYKTAQTARLDLVDFGILPFVSCWAQTLSADNVSPPGVIVHHDLEPFLRTALLAGAADRGLPAAPAPAQPEAP